MARALRRLAALVLAGAAVGAALGPARRALLWRWELNPVLRGRLVAERQGCLDCHRGEAGREIPNPGSRWGTVPRFQGGNAMMYATSRAELEEFIRFGAPRAWLDNPAAAARLDAQRVRMPAYGERLGAAEIADLVAWVAAVEGVEPAGGGPAVAGRALAREQGCLACHGIEGSGGLPNPGSLGGFVPGFLGRNFTDLVRDRAEFDEWVRDGTSSRLAGNPLVAWFWRRQALAMPAYGEALDEEQLDALWGWIGALRAEPGGAAGTVRGGGSG